MTSLRGLFGPGTQGWSAHIRMPFAKTGRNEKKCPFPTNARAE